jgi:hypothetical protein
VRRGKEAQAIRSASQSDGQKSDGQTGDRQTDRNKVDERWYLSRPCSVDKRGLSEDEVAVHPVQGLEQRGTPGYVGK